MSEAVCGTEPDAGCDIDACALPEVNGDGGPGAVGVSVTEEQLVSKLLGDRRGLRDALLAALPLKGADALLKLLPLRELLPLTEGDAVGDDVREKLLLREGEADASGFRDDDDVERIDGPALDECVGDCDAALESEDDAEEDADEDVEGDPLEELDEVGIAVCVPLAVRVPERVDLTVTVRVALREEHVESVTTEVVVGVADTDALSVFDGDPVDVGDALEMCDKLVEPLAVADAE